MTDFTTLSADKRQSCIQPADIWPISALAMVDGTLVLTGRHHTSKSPIKNAPLTLVLASSVALWWASFAGILPYTERVLLQCDVTSSSYKWPTFNDSTVALIMRLTFMQKSEWPSVVEEAADHCVFPGTDNIICGAPIPKFLAWVEGSSPMHPMVARVGLLHWVAAHCARLQGGAPAMPTPSPPIVGPNPLSDREWQGALRTSSAMIAAHALLAQVNSAYDLRAMPIPQLDPPPTPTIPTTSPSTAASPTAPSAPSSGLPVASSPPQIGLQTPAAPTQLAASPPTYPPMAPISTSLSSTPAPVVN